MIRQTSLVAYQDITEDGTALSQRRIILNFIKIYSDGLTRQEVSRMLQIKINAVCGRVRELVKRGSLFEDGKKQNRFSCKQNYILKAK